MTKPCVVRPLAIALVALMSAPAWAQKLEWAVPDGAFVEYERKRTRFDFPGDQRILRLGPDPAPGFYAYDLDKSGTLTMPGPSILDLGSILALSLDGKRARAHASSRVRRSFDHVQKFGRVEVRGRVETTEAEDPKRIHQKAEFTLRAVEPVFDGLRRDLWDLRRLEGDLVMLPTTLSFERVVDAEQQRVVSFDIELKGALIPKNRQDDERERRSFAVAEEWRLVAIREPGYSGFRSEVNDAIARAQKHLTTKLAEWLRGHEMKAGANESGHTYGTGKLALVLLAIQKGNPDREIPIVQEGFAELRRREPQDTYSLANAILAIETLYESANEIQQLRQGLIERPARRHPNDEDRGLLQEWSKRILSNHDLRVDPGYRLRFNYTSAPNYDNSNTQYAALGLQAAARCGIEVSPTTWTSLAAHWLQEQRESESRSIGIRLRSYAELREERRTESRGSSRTVSRRRGRKAEARGFGYRLDSHPYGSMTCAGITGIQVVLGELLAPGRRVPAKLVHQLRTARHEAFAWLVQNWNLRNNPRKHRDHYYYWLYSLERSCELGGIAEVQGHDWYFQGAMQLLRTQSPGGSWGRLEEDCFALLFLKKASAPVVTRN
jgi:hypothetical protein